MTDRRFIVGTCPTCHAVRYRETWLGPVKCDHKPGCIEAKRQKHGRKERLR